MLHQVWIGCVMAFATTIVHAAGMLFAIRVLWRIHDRHPHLKSSLAKASIVASLVLVMFLASVTESAIWALNYVRLGAMDSFEPALYFSMVTFTTLGYGDVVLGPDFRLVASFQAAIGTIMFGWTAALIVAVVQRVYLADIPAGKFETGRRSS